MERPMKPIRIAIAQLNPTVGDYPGNFRKIASWLKAAQKKNADLIAFPELSMSGYPVWDLANKRQFVAAGMKYLTKLAAMTKGTETSVAIGFVDHPGIAEEARLPYNRKGIRTPYPEKSFNAMAWLENGRIRHIQHKRLLPTYDVFLEDVFFEPGSSSSLINWRRGIRLAPTICEDIWDQTYSNKPLADPALKEKNFILNISASPFYRGVSEVRDNLLKRHAVHYGSAVLYANMVGAQDDLIFDGRSMFVDENGKILFKAPAFQEGLFFFDWHRGASEPAHLPQPEDYPTAEVYEALCLGIRDYFRKNGFKKAVIGLSGGIDSALTAALAVDALGPGALTGVTMPGAYSSQGSWADSEDLARRLGIDFRVRPIKEKYAFMMKEFRMNQKQERGTAKNKNEISLAMENLQARLRGLELMYISNDEGRLVLTTGNKSELAVGYCTLYGDMAGGLAVLGDVYKTDVYRLARFRNRNKEVIPLATMEKAPSAELRPGQKDQDSLPPYEVLDEILYLYIEKNCSRDEIIRKMRARKVSHATIYDVIRKVDHNEYKRRQTPTILRVTEKAWFGRRMPITNRFES